MSNVVSRLLNRSIVPMQPEASIAPGLAPLSQTLVGPVQHVSNIWVIPGTPSCSPQAAVHARSRRGSGPPTCFINEQMGALPRAHLPPPSRIARLRLLIALGQGPQHTVWVTLKDQFTRVGYRDLVVSRVL